MLAPNDFIYLTEFPSREMLRFTESGSPAKGARMFQSVEELSQKLLETGYFIDPTMAKVVFLADQMKKPLLLEGPAGSGKTQLTISVAAAAGTHVERLQCFGESARSRLSAASMRACNGSIWSTPGGQHGSWKDLQISLKGRGFFRAGPLMRALEYDKLCVLLIDELDKVDEGFEALLLEILSAWRLSIPEFGTVSARSTPFVVLTSNDDGEVFASRLHSTAEGDAA